MTKISFSEYYQSKETLKRAADNSPKYFLIYEVMKYCKIPLLIDYDDKDYVSLKPKDVIKILWEGTTNNSAIAHYIIINGDEHKRFKFSWNGNKVSNWLESTTIPKTL